MAEFLIKAVDAEHPDQEKSRRGCYKRGDVVCVRPDGHPWGAKEGLPRFVRVRVPGLEVAVVRALEGAQEENDTGEPDVDADGIPRTFRRRRWRFVLADLPAARRNELVSTGATTITRVVARAVVRRKRDGAQFNDL